MLLRIGSTFVVCLSPPFVVYAASGWEQIPQSFLMTLALLFIAFESQKTGRLSIPFSAVVLTSLTFVFRADSAPLIAAVIGAWFLTEGRLFRPVSYVKAGALLIIPGSYLLGMQYFYDDFVPNTAYLKITTFWEGLRLGVTYVTTIKLSWLVPAFLVVLAMLPRKQPFDWFLIGLGGLQTLYLLVVGGDVFPNGRFYLVLTPIVIFWSINRLSTLTIESALLRPLPLILAGFVLMSSSAVPIYKSIRAQIVPAPFDLTEEEITAAAFIACALKPEDGSIGLHFLGFAYHMPGFHVVDFLGKAEPYIARTDVKYGPIGHNKWDYEYAFDTYNIVAIPFPKRSLRYVARENFELKNRDFMYYDIAAVHLSSKKDLVYLDPERFGNVDTGIFLARDLADQPKVKTCAERVQK